jgi:hypothetical protein
MVESLAPAHRESRKAEGEEGDPKNPDNSWDDELLGRGSRRAVTWPTFRASKASPAANA